MSTTFTATLQGLKGENRYPIAKGREFREPLKPDLYERYVLKTAEANGIIVHAYAPKDEVIEENDAMILKWNEVGTRAGCFNFDGTDDYVDTGVVPTEAGELEIAFEYDEQFDDYLIGSRLAADSRCYLAITNTRKIGGGVGKLGYIHMNGTTTLIAGTKYKAKLIWEGSGQTAYLYLKTFTEGVGWDDNWALEASATQLGEVTTEPFDYNPKTRAWGVGK